MATKRHDTGDVITKSAKPARGFPWRLWLVTILMTGAAGAGGYFAYTYREQTITAATDLEACQANVDGLRKDVGALGECRVALEAGGKKGKDLEAQLSQLSTNLDASKEELTTLRAQRADAEKRLAAMEDIQKQFAKLVDAGQLEVKARRGQLVLSLPSEVLFASGSADISEKGRIAVLEIGFTLKKLVDRRFMVLGHTDDVPLKGSSFADNWELSTNRALNVTRILVSAGMDPKNLVPAGVGEHDPIGKDRAKNRRIEIALLPALEELPPLPAAKK